MAHHVFPYLIGILVSTIWAIVLGSIEAFDSDMDLALAYFVFAGLYRFDGGIRVHSFFFLFSGWQFYLWVCALSLYRGLLEIEQNPNKPTRTTV